MPKNKTAVPSGSKIAPAYNIARDEAANTAEINMYGEVVAAHPIDWWTGEPAAGNYIAVDEFLRDLNELEGCDEITIHLNSVGGDAFGGLSIYNRLKNMKARIITENDSIAASAASAIFMAGDVRRMNASSTLMIHGAAGFL